MRPTLQDGFEDWIQNIKDPAQPWWPDAHRWHCLKVLLHFNYLKVSWPGSELQGAQDILYSRWEEALCLYCQCLRRMRKSWQSTRKAIAAKKHGKWKWENLVLTGSRSHTEEQGFLFLFPFPSHLLRREASQGGQPEAGSQRAEEGALLLQSASLSSALMKFIFRHFLKNSTLFF